MSTVTIVAKATKPSTRSRHSKPVNPQPTPAGVEYNTQYNARFLAVIMELDTKQQLVLPSYNGQSRRLEFILMVMKSSWLRFNSQKVLDAFAKESYENVELHFQVPSDTVYRKRPWDIKKTDKGIIVGISIIK